MHIRMRIPIHIHIHIHIHMCVYMCMYIYIYTHTNNYINQTYSMGEGGHPCRSWTATPRGRAGPCHKSSGSREAGGGGWRRVAKENTRDVKVGPGLRKLEIPQKQHQEVAIVCRLNSWRLRSSNHAYAVTFLGEEQGTRTGDETGLRNHYIIIMRGPRCKMHTV